MSAFQMPNRHGSHFAARSDVESNSSLASEDYMIDSQHDKESWIRSRLDMFISKSFPRLSFRAKHGKDAPCLSPNSRWNRVFVVLAVLFCFAAAATGIWLAIITILTLHVRPHDHHNGLTEITAQWTKPNLPGWRPGFSRDVHPVPCHSHNDYWRRIPLYDALAVGCIGVEADIWLEDNDLLVGHHPKALRKNRTLQTLYINPLMEILENQNGPRPAPLDNPSEIRGVFDTSPETSLVLLLDFKTDGRALWPTVLEQLEPLRQHGWLTYYNGASLVQRPITVVGTGNAPFDKITANSTYRDIFYDAPLGNLELVYDATNSYYASAQLSKAVGRLKHRHIRKSQIEMIRKQVQDASSRGLKSRYWDTPSWPISFRNKVWSVLVQNEVGILNVDDLVEATRWNWNWCNVMGVTLC